MSELTNYIQERIETLNKELKKEREVYGRYTNVEDTLQELNK